MSAIYGIFDSDSRSTKEENLLELSKNIFRQAYDEDNFIIENNIGLGNKVFFTTSESYFEKLPNYNHDRTLIYAVDGRIDNRTEIIELLNISTLNKSLTDSELIVLAYEKWGKKCVRYLVGDFAFVIWDKNRQTLFCMRDRLGIRPFFYYYINGRFVFASEVYALTNSLNFVKKPNIRSMETHLYHFGLRDYGETMYQDIFSLPPGSTLTLKDKKIDVKRYWYPEKIKIDRSMEFSNVKEKFLLLLKEAVRCRLRSNTPIGFELSGGVDSSSVVCIADKINTEQEKLSFSSVYENYECDERKYIEEINTHVEIKNRMFEADRVDYKECYGMNFNYKVSPDWPLYLPVTDTMPFSEMIHKHGVRVVLTGEGGDQLVQGSEYQVLDYFRHFNWYMFYKELKSYHFSTNYMKHFLLKPLLPEKAQKAIKNILRKNEKSHSLNIPKVEDIFHFNEFKYKSFYEDICSIAGTLHTSWSDHNFYHIRSMYGLEFRHPFLDSRLIEFALTLPPKYKLHDLVTKVVLREAMKDILPEKIRTRKDKAEFSEIIQKQLNALDFSIFEKEFNIVKLGLISHEEVQESLSQYKSMQDKIVPSVGLKLWRIVNLEYWYIQNFCSQKI